MNGRYHSREFKLEVVKQVESGEKRPAQICREHKLAESSLLKWRKEYAARGETAFTPRVRIWSQSSSIEREANRSCR